MSDDVYIPNIYRQPVAAVNTSLCLCKTVDYSNSECPVHFPKLRQKPNPRAGKKAWKKYRKEQS